MGAAGAELTPAPHFMQNFCSSAPGSPHCGQNLMVVPSYWQATGTAFITTFCRSSLKSFSLPVLKVARRVVLRIVDGIAFGAGGRARAADDSALVEVKMLSSLARRHRIHVQH